MINDDKAAIKGHPSHFVSAREINRTIETVMIENKAGQKLFTFGEDLFFIAGSERETKVNRDSPVKMR